MQEKVNSSNLLYSYWEGVNRIFFSSRLLLLFCELLPWNCIEFLATKWNKRYKLKTSRGIYWTKKKRKRIRYVKHSFISGSFFFFSLCIFVMSLLHTDPIVQMSLSFDKTFTANEWMRVNRLWNGRNIHKCCTIHFPSVKIQAYFLNCVFSLSLHLCRTLGSDIRSISISTFGLCFCFQVQSLE